MPHHSTATAFISSSHHSRLPSPPHGEDRLIGLSDTGVDQNSCFFHDAHHAVRYDVGANDTRHRKIFMYNDYADNTEGDVDAHGTHVAGTLVGEVLNNAALSQYDGIAYKARLVFFDIGKGSGSTSRLSTPRRIVTIVDSVYNQGARIHSASWGALSHAYTTDVASIDSFV